jgi:hypothetical protein
MDPLLGRHLAEPLRSFARWSYVPRMQLSRRSLLFAAAAAALVPLSADAEAGSKAKRNLRQELPTAIGALIVANLIAKRAGRNKRMHRRALKAFRAALRRAMRQLQRAAKRDARQRKRLTALVQQLRQIDAKVSAKSKTPLHARLRRAGQDVAKIRGKALGAAGRTMTVVAAKANVIALHALIGEDGSRAASWLSKATGIGAPHMLIGEDGIIAPSDLNGARGLVNTVARSLRNTSAKGAAPRLNAAQGSWQRAGKHKQRTLTGIRATAVANMQALEGL